MMIVNIMKNDFTLVILTNKHAEKANEFKGGVGYETSLLINNMVDNIEKLIPIMRYKGGKNKAIPFCLKRMTYIDLFVNNNFDERFDVNLFGNRDEKSAREILIEIWKQVLQYPKLLYCRCGS